jgi:Ni/Co efflux regulator RcnB
MKRSTAVAMALALTFAGAQGAMAQDRHDNRDNHDNHGGQNHNWRRGGRIEQNDWQRGQHVDYRAHHLRRPGRGQEWREVDGNYVLAAAATGLILGIAASH